MEESTVFKFHEKSSEFLNLLLNVEDRKTRKQEIRKYLETFNNDCDAIMPDFSPDWQWFNVKNPLSIKTNLKGKILILDFFTYCCINCMHILPDLEALEHQHPVTDGVVIIGVHSAKFDNERMSDNILSAVLRYDITHPVVNDRDARLWQALQVRCWPTLVVVSPHGQILFLVSGEGHREILSDFLGEAIAYFGEQKALSRAEIGLKLEKDGFKESVLRFPGKVCINEAATKLAIADTGHHRIVIADLNGIIQTVIGGKDPGLKDGCYNYARFRAPQGLCFSGDHELFVADTENHVIRKIDLSMETVTTVAGTGCQGQDTAGGGVGVEQPISSPWDLAIAPDNPDVLYIAMAGTHQIWTLFLNDSKDIKGNPQLAGTCRVFAGSGNEENRNNNYPHRAGFAQPSGLALARVPEDSATYSLVVADSESSTIRLVSLKDGSVKGLVGGDIDPMNLFAYGDVDGKGNKAKLQHPLGVGTVSGSILVADSYNHKIKLVNALTKSCMTLLGSGCPGDMTGLGVDPGASVLNEPGGLTVHPNGKLVYIADTNNHSVKVLDIDSREILQLPILPRSQDAADYVPRKPRRLAEALSIPVPLSEMSVYPGQTVHVRLCVTLPPNWDLNRAAPNKWALHSDDAALESALEACYGSMTCVRNQPLCVFTLPDFEPPTARTITLEAHVSIFPCSHDNDTCHNKNLVFSQPLTISSDRPTDPPAPTEVVLVYKP